jgi:hypothetical protein
MKKNHLLFTFVSLAAASLFLGGCEGCDTQRPAVKKEETGPCGHLSKRERDFSMKLSQVHRDVFCQKMTAAERTEVMDMADRTGDPDTAVERILQKYKQSRACPTEG